MADRAALESLKAGRTAIRRNILPYFLKKYPGHELGKIDDPQKAAYKVRGMAEKGDEMCKAIFQVQARALGLFFDQMVSVFDPDALIVGGGAVETSPQIPEVVSSMEVRGASAWLVPSSKSRPTSQSR